MIKFLIGSTVVLSLVIWLLSSSLTFAGIVFLSMLCIDILVYGEYI